MLQCICPGCDRPARSKRKGGYCLAHYKRWLATGDACPGRPLQTRKPRVGLCPVPKCGREVFCGGYCAGHYTRLRRGDLRPDIPLRPQGLGCTTKDGYRQISVNGRPMAEHRVIMERMIGRSLIPGETVHHKNGRRADNRPENLELWTSAQPYGQRVEDLVAFAHQIIDRYGETVNRLGISETHRMAPQVAD